MKDPVYDAVAVGFCCIDEYSDGRSYPTGNGVDWLVHLARANMRCALVSATGNDAYADQMNNFLLQEKIDAQHVKRLDGQTSIMRMGFKNGVDRVHLEAIDGVMDGYTIDASENEFIQKASWVHTDLFGGVLDYLVPWREKGIHTILDLSVFSTDPSYEIENYIAGAEYAFISFEGTLDEAKAHIMKLWELGPRLVVATLGDRGSVAFDGAHFIEYGIVPATVVNTVGAGDAYIAGFCLAQMNGADIPTSMQEGAKTAAYAISQFKPY